MTQTRDTLRAGSEAEAAVRVLGADGTGAAGMEVRWTVESGGGRVSPERTSTDADGVARTTWTVGTSAGENVLAAWVERLPPVRFRALVIPASATKLTVQPDSARLTSLGDSIQLQARAFDQFGNPDTTTAPVWESSDTTIAQVSARGWVVARGNGAAQISARLNGVSQAARVEVSQEAATLQILPEEKTLTALGDTFRLSVVAFDRNRAPIVQPRTVWSAPDSIVRVDSLGLVTALLAGTGEVRARMGLVEDTSRVRVEQRVDSVAVGPTPGAATLGTSVTLEARALDARGNSVAGVGFVWSSSDPAVATVDDMGRLTARGVGVSTVSARGGGVVGSLLFTVRPQIAQMAVVPAEASLAMGEVRELGTSFLDGAGQSYSGPPVTWMSSDPAVASVSAAGAVTGVRSGVATVTASAEGRSASARVTVTSATLLVLSPSGGAIVAQDGVVVLTAPAGAVATPLAITIRPQALGSTSGVLEGSEFEFGPDGAVFAVPVQLAIRFDPSRLSPGTPASELRIVKLGPQGWSPVAGSQVDASANTVTAPIAGFSSYGVAPAVRSVSVTPAAPTVAVHATTQLGAELRDAGGAALRDRVLSWSSASAEVAQVDASGRLTGVAPGQATITVSSEGQSGSAQATVVAGAPSTLEATSGNSQSGVVGTRLPLALAVRVTDGRGNPVSGATVQWSAANGSGSVDPALSTTGAAGVAEALWTLGGTAGTQSVQAQLPAGGALGFTATATPGPEAKLEFAAQPASTAVGHAMAPPVAVKVEDSYGNLVSTATRSVTLALAANPASASLGGTLTVGATGGIATFGDLTLSRVANGYVLQASSEGLSPATSGPFNVSPAAASQATSQISADSAQMRANGTSRTTVLVQLRDAANAPLTSGGHAVTLLTTAGTLGPVQDRGDGSYTATLTAPVSAGVARVTGAVGGLAISDDASITLISAVASVEVTAGRTALEGGETVQLAATLRDTLGATVSQTGRTVAWSSSNPGLATVSPTGLVTAIAQGVATITATSDGRSGSKVVHVLPGNPIQLQLVRFNGGSGSIVISSGIPLPPGRLQPSALAGVVLVVGGVEQPLYVEALESRHSDGSLRSVLIQTAYDVGATPVAAKLYLRSTRLTTNRAKVTNDGSVPAAAALPTDPNYLVSTGLVGPTLTSAQTRLISPTFQTYENQFVEFGDLHWIEDGSDWGQNYYDQALIYFAFWARTGNPTYWSRAVQLAINYRRDYLEANNYVSSPHWAQVEGLEVHYLLTGDERPRYAIGRVGLILEGFQPLLQDKNNEFMDTRIQSRLLLNYLSAWRLNIPGRDWAGLLREALPRILSTQGADGSYRFRSLCNTQFNYMVGLLNDALIKYYTSFEANASIPGAVQRSADFMWSTQWIAAESSFQYSTAICTEFETDGILPAPDLNLLIAPTFGWVYRRTGNAAYRVKGDQIFAGGVAGAYLWGVKQFNESYRQSFRYPADRQ